MSIQQMMFAVSGAAPLTGRQVSVYSGSNSYFALGVATDGGTTNQNFYVSGEDINSGGLWVISKFTSAGANSWFSRGTPSAGGASPNPWGCYKNIATDSSGNTYANASFRNSAGTVDAGYLQKVNTSGTIQWQRKLTIAGNSVHALGTALDATAANVYFAGDCNIASNTAGWVAKYNSSGTIQWQSQLTNGGANSIYGLCSDSSSNVFVVGRCNSVGTIIKYNSSGTVQWQSRLTGTTALTSVGVDSSGNIYVAGSNGSFNVLVSINSAGSAINWQSYTNTAFGFPDFTVADSTGNTYGTWFNGSSTFYVTKFNSSGVNTWSNTITGMGNNGGIWLDEANNYLYVATTNLNSPFVSHSAYRLPATGTNTVGSLGNTGTSSTQSYNSSTTLSNSSPGLSITSGAWTTGAGTLTDAAGDLTITTTALSTGTVLF